MVNVIIPIYRARKTLRDALDSLCLQTKKMFLVTLVQDGDDEDYTDIVNEYITRGLHLSIIRLEENVGPGMARQAGIDASMMCDYVMFLDSDDLLMPTAIATLYAEAKKNNFDILSSDILAEHQHEPNQLLSVITTPATWCHGKIYRLKYLQENNIRFIPELRINEDSYFNLVAINLTDKKGKVQETTYYWRDNKNSITRGSDEFEFAQRSWPLYFLSQVYGVDRISQSEAVDWRVTALTLLNAYYTHMKYNYFKINDDVTEVLNILKNNSFIQTLLNDGEFWKFVADNLKAAETLRDGSTVIFYHQRFYDWIEQYIRR